MKKTFSLLITTFALFFSSCAAYPKQTLFVLDEPQTSFGVGDAFTSEGLSVIDVEKKSIVEDYSLSFQEGQKLDTLGTYTVSVSKANYASASYNIKVLHKLVIDTYPKQTFNEGEYFSIAGLILKDETGQVVIGATTSFRIGNILSVPGEIEITLSKENYMPTSYVINVVPNDRMRITSLPTKTTYKQGDAFTSNGLVIKDINTKTVITDYTLSLEEGMILKTTGTIKVVASHEDYPEVSFTITVEEGETPIPLEDKTLNIYYINDTHGSYVRNVSTGSGQYPEAGMAYIGDYLIDKKTDDPDNTLIISGGDMFQGGVESNFTDGAIMVDAMNHIGFDAMALGNHELDWKPEVLAEREEEMNFPLLSCNTFYAGTKIRPDFIKPYTVIEKDGYKVGIIGAAKKNLGSSVLASISDQFDFPSPGSYIKECSDELRTSYQCDVVILVSHDGGTTSNTSQTLSTDYSSLTGISSVSGQRYVDTLLFAHDHYKKAFDSNNVPVMESACNGEYIGNISLELSSDGGLYSVDSYQISGTNYAYTYCQTADSYIANLPTDDKYKDQIGDPERILGYLDKSYTETEFAVLACQILYLYVNDNKSLFGGVTVYFGDVNAGTIRDNVSSGAFTIRDLVKVCPFQNEIAIQKCNATNVTRIRKNTVNYNLTNDPTYSTDGYTYGVSISYNVEKYTSLQKEYVYFGKTIYDAFFAYFGG